MTPAARFHDLVVDAHDVHLVAGFWAGVFGMATHPAEDGSVTLQGDHAWDRLLVLPAPREATACTIHVDVSIEHITRFLQLGASVVDASSYPWVVLEGPEGSEICAFPLEAGRRRRLIDLVMDTCDPVTAARWWADVLGTGYHASADGDYAWVEPVTGAPFESIVFARQEVPAPALARRLRPRLVTHDLGALFARGASRAAQVSEDCWLLADPTGIEFFAREADFVVRPDDED